MAAGTVRGHNTWTCGDASDMTSGANDSYAGLFSRAGLHDLDASRCGT